ncbi:glycosyltransferase family 2 protein [Lactobacillus sp. ESL0684]|uniref:glycosyltransferase family 2 protein n=1 Tax=Lactobacillus sp. ESL0684 TaxID=2983213 RepID=UPI0023F88863|nr:glycosyltransferase family 2 protein [Lactobacillus sp. ESL0684]WEV43956.1 glycosyltransferase family 2 protein [Lactobacillus sp. ESL0684]
MTEISIIVAAYNEEKLLARCLTSLIKQDFNQDYEIIVVDDGSQDQTLEIAQAFQAKNRNKIKVIHQTNQGQGLARNTGLKQAKGKFIGFTDADDWVEPNYLSSLYRNINKYQSDIAVCDVHKVWVEEGYEQDVRSLPSTEGLIDIAQYITEAQNNSYSWNKLYRREIWQKYHFKQMIYEDLDLIIPIISHCHKLSYIPEPLYNYYKHANSTTTSYRNPRLFDIFTAYRDLISNCAPKYREAAEYDALKRVLINLTTPGFRYYLAYFIELLQQLNLGDNDLIKSSKFYPDYQYYNQFELLPRNFYCEENNNLTDWLIYQNNERFKTFAINNSTQLLTEVLHKGGVIVFEALKPQSPIGYLRATDNFIVIDNNICVMLGIKPFHPLINYLIHQNGDFLVNLKQIASNPQNYAQLLFDVKISTLAELQNFVLLA